MKSLNLSAKEMVQISGQCILVLVVFCAFLAMSGCATTEKKDPDVIFKTVNRAILVMPEVPDHLVIDYQGEYPTASPEGGICFADGEIKNLQELLQFLTNQNRSLKELLR